MKQALLFLCLALTLFSACKKEKVTYNLCDEPNINSNNCITDSNQVKDLLLGKWNWTQSINAWTQEKTNPCTDSISKAYEFLGGGAVKYYENGSYVSTGTYHFQSGSGFMLWASDTGAHFGLNGWVSVCNSFLVVDDMPVDGPKVVLAKE